MRRFEDDPGVMLEGCSCLLCLASEFNMNAHNSAEMLIVCLQKYPAKLGPVSVITLAGTSMYQNQGALNTARDSDALAWDMAAARSLCNPRPCVGNSSKNDSGLSRFGRDPGRVNDRQDKEGTLDRG